MGRRNEHSREEQREMALAEARSLIQEQGRAGFSMRQVASAMGYTVGQLYLLFKNQDELFVALNETTAARIHRALEEVMRQEADDREAVRQAARAYIQFALQQPHLWTLLFEHRLPAGSPVPQANLRQVQALFELIENRLARLFPDADAMARRRLATALWSGVHGVAVLAQSGKLNWSGVSEYGEFSDRLVQGVLAAPSLPARQPG